MSVISVSGAWRRARVFIALCAIGCLLAVLCLCLPICEFSDTLYQKRVGNTVIGDERYTQARDDTNAHLQALSASAPGLSMRVTEDVLQRVNSKGETTSTVTFRVTAAFSKTGFDFIASGLPSGRVLCVMLICSAAGLAAALLSLRGGLNTPLRELSPLRTALRGAVGWLAFIAALCVPVFALNTVALFERGIIAPLETGGGDAALLASAGGFLYGGQAGEALGEWLKGLEYHATPALWCALPALLAQCFGGVLLCRGALRHTLARGGLYAFILIVCVIILYPYYVMLITGFRSNAESTDMNFTHMLPTEWVWSNITDIFARGVPKYLLNSLALSFGATAVALACGIPAAYAMARMKFKGKRVFLGFVIMSQMFSPVVLLVGISRLMGALKLNDSVTGLMLINAAFNQAFAIWLLRGTFLSISAEMEQAACIDGCNKVGALIRVLLPMAAPGIVTTLIFVFINSWNEYTISTVLISTPANKPITYGITQFSSFNMIEWQYFFASALIATIPVILLFMGIEKHLVGGLTSGGVKG